MKVLIFSDLHGHNHREFSTQELGVNTRLRNQTEVIDAMTLCAIENEVHLVWFLGDLYQLKNNLDSQVITMILNHLTVLANEVEELLIIPGHHDYRMWHSEPLLLEYLEEHHKHVTVVQEPKWIKYAQGDVPLFAAPCTRGIKELNKTIETLDMGDPKKKPIFLGHQDVIGVQYGGFVVENGLDADVLAAKFKWSFLGHYHNMMSIRPNVISVGAPLQRNFGETGYNVGWWIYDTETAKPTFHENTKSPRFYDFKCADDTAEAPGVHDRDFYRVTISGTKLFDSVKKLKWKRVSYDVEPEKKQRSVLKFSDTKEDIIMKYVNARAGKLDEERLVELGRNYL